MCRVLDGRKVAADLLAKEVHSSVPPWKDQLEATNDKSCKNAVEDLVNVPDEEGIEFRADDLAIWIDPIGSYLIKKCEKLTFPFSPFPIVIGITYCCCYRCYQ